MIRPRRPSGSGYVGPRWPYTRNEDSPQAEGLIGWWPMAHPGGSTLYDLSGRGGHGTLTNMESTDWEANRFGGQLLSLGGTNEHVNISPMSHLATARGSFSCWFQSTTDNLGTLFGVSNTGANTACWLLSGNGATATLTDEIITIACNNAGVTGNRVGFVTSTRTILFDGNPHHITVTAGGTYGIIIDGIDRAITVGAGADDGQWFNRSGVNDVQIGMVEIGGGVGNIQPLVARVWDVRVYDRAMPASEAFGLYDPETRFDLYYELGRKTYSFAPVAAGGDNNPSLFRHASLSGLGSGGPLFHNPLAA